MSMEDTANQSVYDSALYVGANSDEHKLSSSNTEISVLNYNWLVSCQQKPDENKILLSATMISRYKFSDKLILEGILTNNKQKIEWGVFDLKKTTEKQEFEILYDKKLDNIEVYARILIRSIGYCSNEWATEIDFTDAHRVSSCYVDVLQILELADQFEIPNLMAKCGIILSDFGKYKKLSVIERLELADKHNLVHLQVTCFERIHAMSLDDRNKFFEENRERIQELSEMTVKNLI